MYVKKSRDESLFRRTRRQIKAPKHKSLKNDNNQDTSNTQIK
jgi:hypothetical protein